MSKPTREEIEEYVDNEVKDGRVTVGFEDVSGNTSHHIFKRMVSGLMLIKSQFSPIVRSEPVFFVGEKNDINYQISEDERLVGAIPSAPCFAVFCLVPKNETFETVKSKPHDMKSVLLGYEYPNCEHPDWIEEYKKEFIDSFDYEEKHSIENYEDEDKESKEAEEILSHYKDYDIA